MTAIDDLLSFVRLVKSLDRAIVRGVNLVRVVLEILGDFAGILSLPSRRSMVGKATCEP